jgi:polyisoprenoid-binding protein YceI
MRRDPSGLKLERIEAWVAAGTLKTGMSLRDEHMRKRIFTTAAGELPDLRFESGDVDCPGVAAGREATCAITGTMAIRGAAHAFSIPLKVRQDGTGAAFRAVGDGVLKLSDYGIEQPSQLGVKTANEVNIHLDLSGKEADLVATASGRR